MYVCTEATAAEAIVKPRKYLHTL